MSRPCGDYQKGFKKCRLKRTNVEAGARKYLAHQYLPRDRVKRQYVLLIRSATGMPFKII